MLLNMILKMPDHFAFNHVTTTDKLASLSDCTKSCIVVSHMWRHCFLTCVDVLSFTISGLLKCFPHCFIIRQMQFAKNRQNRSICISLAGNSLSCVVPDYPYQIISIPYHFLSHKKAPFDTYIGLFIEIYRIMLFKFFLSFACHYRIYC